MLKIRKRVFWLVALIGLYCAWTASPVLAHAELLTSTPKPNEILAQAPTQVRLLLSEPLEQELSSIKVYNSDRISVEYGKATIDSTNPAQISVSLPPLSDGVYTVIWKVISRIDGHGSAGSFPFAVGNVEASSLPPETTDISLPFSAVIAKWLLLASAALLAGLFPAMFFVWDPALKSDAEVPGLSNHLLLIWEGIYKFALAGILLACVFGVLTQAGQTTGLELAAPWSKETIQVLTATRLGVFWLIRIVLALGCVWLTRSQSVVWKQQTRFMLELVLLLTISLTSHAPAEVHPFLPVIADWLHLIGMAFWFGGLAYLISGLAVLQKIETQSRTRITSEAAKRFSLLALPSVGIVGLTGIYSATLRVGSITALFDTLYGHALLFKQSFVAPLLLIAAVNFLIISPRLTRDSSQNIPNSIFIQRFKKMVLVEIILACLLLGSVSLMTYLPPARIPPPPTTQTAVTKVDDLKVDFSMSPGLVGQNTFTVRLTPARSVEAVKGVLLTFVPVQADLPSSDMQMTAQGNGIFTAQGSNIGFPGDWQVEVSIDRPTSYPAIVTFDFNIPKPGANDSRSAAIFQLSIFLIVLIGLLIGLNLFIQVKKAPRLDSQSTSG
jgi:copper transport protein